MTNYSASGAPNVMMNGLARPLVLQQTVQGSGLHGLIRLLTKRWKWIIGSIAISLLLALIITGNTKPIFESTTTIELNKTGGGSLDLGLDDIASQPLSSGESSLQIDEQTEAAILESDSLALDVIKQLGLAAEPPFVTKGGMLGGPVSEQGLPLEEAPHTRTRLLQIFKANLKVTPVRQTRLIQVSYQSRDPKQAARIANALVESYKNQYLQSHYDATSEASEWLTKQLSNLKANVEDSEKKLTDFEKDSGILGLDLMPTGSGSESSGGEQVHSVTIQKLDQLNTELTAAQANRIEKEAIYRLVQTGNGAVVASIGNDPLAVQSNSMVLTQGGGLSNLQQLQQQQNALKVNLAEASTTYGENNRHLKELQTQIDALNVEIQQELHRIVQRAQADFQLAQQTEDGIRHQFDQQQEEASKLNEKTVQLAVLSQEAFSQKKLYEDLYTKLQEANVSAGLKATNITIVDPARTQSVPVLPKLGTNLAMGTLFGIFFGFAAAYAIDSFDRTVSDPMEVEELTGRPVIGVIPDFGEKSTPYGKKLANGAKRLARKRKQVTEEDHGPNDVWVLDHPESAAAEAFRALRTSILLSRAGGGPKVILITSCTPGEGKTTVTANLAVALAQHNKRVIIIEADMRRPRIRRKLNVPGEVGLSNVLAGAWPSNEAIHHGIHVPSLDILPSGPRPPLPADILGSPAFDKLLEELRSNYDVVLIDSPPALLVTDAVAISLKADAVIWVAHAGVVTRPYLGRANRLIDRDGLPVIGFVMNRMSKSIASYGYGYGYEYESYGSYYEEGTENEA